MLSRFSVKKPFVIIVAVVIVLIFGAVSVTKMSTNLLPKMDIPYLAVITTDPGSSAENVESEVTNVLEGSLGTVTGVVSVQSTSADNYSMIFLEFEDGTNMDSAMVRVTSALNRAQSSLPDSASTPNLLEISPDSMMATMYIAVGSETDDIYALSDQVQNTVIPELERVDGVADVSATGLVSQSVEVRLNQDKIDQVNNQMLSQVNDQLADAKAQIDEGQASLDSAQAQVEAQQANLTSTASNTYDQLGQAESALTTAVAAQTSLVTTLSAQKQSMAAQITSLDAAIVQTEQALEQIGDLDPGTSAALQEQLAALQEQRAQLEAASAQLDAQVEEASATLGEYQDQLAQVQTGGYSAAASIGSGTAQLASAQSALAQSQAELDNAREQYEDARQQAIDAANLDGLLTVENLSGLIYAQNLSMPAGYIDGESDGQWLLRVGDEMTSPEELAAMPLVYVEGIGQIYLGDVADITLIDNAGDSYTNINGNAGVVLSVFKTSTASASDVSKLVSAAIADMGDRYDNLDLVIMDDTGSYIGVYIVTILKSLLLGAFLAVVVLALFLKDWRPTIIVAISMPFSVLCALVLMYFTNIDINIMSLSGLALAIGMLVDNSIVVLENIYRLRTRGVSAPRAAVQGAKQIAGAVVASTLTTVCVFLPVVFTTGLVNQMLLPFALSLSYVLAASLLVALTLVPTLSSWLFANHTPKMIPWLERVKDIYGKALDYALRRKVLPLGLAVVLLVVALAGALNTGITLIPNMTTSVVSVTVMLPEDTPRDEAYRIGDQVIDAALSVEGVQDVGMMDGAASMSMISNMEAKTDSVSGFILYLTVTDDVDTEREINRIQEDLLAATAGINCTVATQADAADSMSSMLGSGLSITLTGPDKDTLMEISQEVMDVVGQVEGYTDIDNGMEDAAAELHLVVDKEALSEAGYTVAQLYQDLAGQMEQSGTAAQMRYNGRTLDVTVVDELDPITKESLLETPITITNQQTGESTTYMLSDFATVEQTFASTSISHTNGNMTMQVTASVDEGYNNALLSRELTGLLDQIDLPSGYTLSYGGELENINTMLSDMMLMLLLGLILIYLVMVAQFQSLLSPFIVILTVPLAFTGGFFALWFAGEPISMLSLMGFAVLMGTVVNNGIVMVDYINQLRLGGLDKRDALIAAGKTRLRPVLMTALTTILAMLPMIFSNAIGSSMELGMALVVAGGLLYATLMTLFVVPCMYDILYRKQPYQVDLGDESIDQDAGDAQEYLKSLAQ